MSKSPSKLADAEVDHVEKPKSRKVDLTSTLPPAILRLKFRLVLEGNNILLYYNGKMVEEIKSDDSAQRIAYLCCKYCDDKTKLKEVLDSYYLIGKR